MHPRSTLPGKSRSLRAAFGLALALAFAAAAGAQEPAGSLPEIEITAGIHLIHAELADSEGTRMRGLMYRPALAPNHGMFFLFEDAQKQCMWMRNTLLPLSVAFIDDAGTIVNIEEMKPQTDDSHCSRKPVRYALEMAGQWFDRHGLRAGSALQGIGKRAPR